MKVFFCLWGSSNEDQKHEKRCWGNKEQIQQLGCFTAPGVVTLMFSFASCWFLQLFMFKMGCFVQVGAERTFNHLVGKMFETNNFDSRMCNTQAIFSISVIVFLSADRGLHRTAKKRLKFCDWKVYLQGLETASSENASLFICREISVFLQQCESELS